MDDDQRSDPAPHSAPDFTRLPPRIMPEQMVETQAVTHPESAVFSGTETEWQIRTSGGG
jgi:hypothetical protein